MLGPIFSALTGLKNASQRLQNSANNVANINTAGFKKSDVNSARAGTTERGCEKPIALSINKILLSHLLLRPHKSRTYPEGLDICL
jgi:hypothetical protein